MEEERQKVKQPGKTKKKRVNDEGEIKTLTDRLVGLGFTTALHFWAFKMGESYLIFFLLKHD